VAGVWKSGPRPEIRYENPEQCGWIYKIPIFDEAQMQSCPDTGCFLARFGFRALLVVGLLIMTVSALLLFMALAWILTMFVQVRMHGNSHPQNTLAEKGKNTIAQRGDTNGAYIAHEKDLKKACLAFIKFV
jgi:uncharacterized paraquat-inducible protein A